MRFIDLFAGLGGFHSAMASLGHECVFASELDAVLRENYERNFPAMRGKIFGDIRESKRSVPEHEILCAGFPCQPFSKSGFQEGFLDETRGTLFHEILEIIVEHKPPYVFLENVGNFERHDEGRTWAVIKAALSEQGYHVRGTEHVSSGGHGLISPHHLGYPHMRERFFIVATLDPLPRDPFPQRRRNARTTLKDIEQTESELSKQDREETKLLDHYVQCIDHWNHLIKALPEDMDLPSFPIWGDELNARYPYQKMTPSSCTVEYLRKRLRLSPRNYRSKSDLLARLPSYARSEAKQFPKWKIDFIDQNRKWFREISPYITREWSSALRSFPPSLRKLEWNCQGEERDLWEHVLQFRPSGLRVKRYSSSPALVAMTATQIPILGPKRRLITRTEGLRLQGFGDGHVLPESHEHAFRALGNAVHVGVVRAIAQQVLVNTQ